MIILPVITCPEPQTARIEFGAYLPYVEVFTLYSSAGWKLNTASGAGGTRYLVSAKVELKVFDAGKAFWGR